MDSIIIICAQYLYLGSAVVYVFFLWSLKGKIRRFFFIQSALSFSLSLFIAKILSHFINDPRPFVVEHVKPLISHVADNGFPSDHTLLTMAIASIVYVYNKKLGIALYSIALIVGISRILAKIHHPLDIFGSILIACGAVVIVVRGGKILLKKEETREK